MGKKSHYEVEYITKMKVQDSKRFFRVKWVGYPSCQNTWQPEQHLNQALIKSFYEQEQQREQKRQQLKQKKLQKVDKTFIKILQIKDRQEDDDNLYFLIMKGNKKQTVTRDYLFNNYPKHLARFYLAMHNEKINE